MSEFAQEGSHGEQAKEEHGEVLFRRIQEAETTTAHGGSVALRSMDTSRAARLQGISDDGATSEDLAVILKGKEES